MQPPAPSPQTSWDLEGHSRVSHTLERRSASPAEGAVGTPWGPGMRETPPGRGRGRPNAEAREAWSRACGSAERLWVVSELGSGWGSRRLPCFPVPKSEPQGAGNRSGAMGLLPAVRGATRGCSGRLVTRAVSQEARRGVRPGGEELGRLRLDDLAPAPRLELLFGLSPCLLALRAARRRVARLLLQAGRAGLQGERAELLRAAEARGIPVLRPRRQKLDALCRQQVHQGVCMEVSPLQPQPWTETMGAGPGADPQQLWLVLDGLQDPRNLGAVLRSAHFLGVDKVITSRRSSCPLTPVVSKASAGAMEVMDVFSTDDLAGFLQARARQGWLVAGAVGPPGPETAQSSEVPVTSCLDFLWDRPTLLVLGNEGSGLSQEVQASCRCLLTILPGRQLPPGLESLNVSVAAGILLHAICSQRKALPADGDGRRLLQDPTGPLSPGPGAAPGSGNQDGG